MAKYYKPALLNDTKVRTGKCRLSFPHLFEKYSESDKYQAVFLWPKTDKEMTKTVKAAIENAKENGLRDKWSGKLPKNFDSPIRDGDESDYDGYEGCYYLTAKNANRKPQVVDLDRDDILDAEEVYPGCYVRATISLFAYSNSGKNGVSCILNNVQKLADGEQFGGGTSSADDDFDDDDDVQDVEDEDDDDLMG